jgi:hypothetical protein
MNNKMSKNIKKNGRKIKLITEFFLEFLIRKGRE